MTKTEHQYRKQREQHTGPRGRGHRYPASLRIAALALLRTRQAEGATLAAISRELDIPTKTLSQWIARDPTPPGATPGFRPVRIVGRAAITDPDQQVIVHGPAGLRIEGLDVATLADLLRSLA